MLREEMLQKKIAVVYGGINSEREISLETGEAICRALERTGYSPLLIDQDRQLPMRLHEQSVEIVFIALHGKWGEDGCLQGLLEVMGIPYTGTKVTGSALAMDKHLSKIAFRSAGLPVLPGTVFYQHQDLYSDCPYEFPVVVKPVTEGSSIGISIVKNESDFRTALNDAFVWDERVLIEPFKSGREIQVTVLNDEALGAIWVKPAGEFYDYKAKYSTDDTEYIYPAPLADDLYQHCLDVTLQATRTLRAEGVTRTDLIVDDNGDVVILEVNTLPGMTSHSLVPKTAEGVGISFDELAERILLTASLGLSQPEKNQDA